ncbi:hypothetical protein LY78DRAFT_686854 [Colletotrichum sublineola]|nr:hypothetical protein LY78DRAFT_686854 [Colletotrichum sublineola]
MKRFSGSTVDSFPSARPFARLSTTANVPGAPDVPFKKLWFKDGKPAFDCIVAEFEQNSFKGPNDYHRNWEANTAYDEKEPNGHRLRFPVLFIEARWDTVCDTVLFRLSDPHAGIVRGSYRDGLPDRQPYYPSSILRSCLTVSRHHRQPTHPYDCPPQSFGQSIYASRPSNRSSSNPREQPASNFRNPL